MEKNCHISIEGKGFNLEFKVIKDNLYKSRYFHDIIEKNQQTEFFFSNNAFDKNVYTLYFSEFPSENITKNQINICIEDKVLFQLIELNKIFQTNHINKKIQTCLELRDNFNYLIEKCNNKRGNHNIEEKVILTKLKLNEKNIEIFMESKLSEERKIRILSKMEKLESGKLKPEIIKKWIFNLENNEYIKKIHKGNDKKNEKGERHIFMIIYSEQKIYKEMKKRILCQKMNNILFPNNGNKNYIEVKKKLKNLENNERKMKIKLEKNAKAMGEMLFLQGVDLNSNKKV